MKRRIIHTRRAIKKQRHKHATHRRHRSYKNKNVYGGNTPHTHSAAATKPSPVTVSKWRATPSAPLYQRAPSSVVPEVRSKSWFQYIRKNDKFKAELKKMGRDKTDVPFNLNGLEEREREVAVPYYTQKLPMHTAPMYLHEVEDNQLPWIDDRERTSSSVARTKCSNIHYGQRKLLLNETLFLALYGVQHAPEISDEEPFLSSDKIDANFKGMPKVPKSKNVPLVVYAGAGGTGQHLLYECKLFKGAMFYCYDMSTFDQNLQDEVAAGNYPNLLLHRQLFLDDDRDYFAVLSKDKGYEVYFMSDIRSVGGKVSFEEKEERVDVDNQRQYDWVETIRPIAAHLKWRIPYTLNETNIMEPSVFMLEPWVGADSGELRQMVERPPDGHPYQYGTIALEYIQSRIVMLNNIIKQYAFYEHPLPCSGYYYYDESEKSIEESGLGMDHCWNCTYEIICWCMYLGADYEKMCTSTDDRYAHKFMRDNEKAILHLFNMNTRINCRSLNINCHGMHPDLTAYEKYMLFTDEAAKERKAFNAKRADKTNVGLNMNCVYSRVDKGDSWFNLPKSARLGSRPGNRSTKATARATATATATAKRSINRKTNRLRSVQ